MADRYFGTYHRFRTASKDDGGALMSADNLVGDRFSIEFVHEGMESVAWVVNRFGKRVGFFDNAFSRKLQLYAARDFTLVAVLSLVGFSNKTDPGEYFGECAVMAYNPAYEKAFEQFVNTVSQRMASNLRTKVDLGPEAADRIIESDGEWVPKQTVPMPAKESGIVIMKTRQSLADKAIEQGRAGNKGCYAINVLFLVVVVALVAFGLLSCTGVI